MFWNDPNLYNLTYKDVPPVQTPFFGHTPFIPPTPFLGQAPFFGAVPPRAFPPFPPAFPPTFPMQQAFIPYPMMPYAFNPYFPTPPVNPMLQPYNLTFPFPNPYRPFTF